MNKVGFAKECWLKLQGYEKQPFSKLNNNTKLVKNTNTGKVTKLPNGATLNERESYYGNHIYEYVKPDGSLRVVTDYKRGDKKGLREIVEYPSCYNSGTKKQPAYISDDAGNVVKIYKNPKIER